MAKDPAFLFYSKDFYEGTRMMLPEERACYIDLLIYQHQHGIIPLDIKRVLMYCSGIAEATLIATLEAKFKRCDQGYYNNRLDDEITKRADYTSTQSINGRIGQLMKSAKGIVNHNELQLFKQYVYGHLGKEKALEMIEKNETTLEGLLKASLKHLVNVNVNANEVLDEVQNENTIVSIVTTTREKNFELYPTFDDFWNQWPEKVAKQTAQKSWSKLSQKEKERVMMHIEPFIQAKHLSGQHLPHAATYLNQKRFNDEMLPQATKAPIVQADGRMRTDDIVAILKQKAIEKHQNQISHEPTSLPADNARS